MMSMISEKDIVLSYDELRVLLAGLDCYSCEGVFMPRKGFQDNDIIMVLNDLSKQGLIWAKENGFALRNDLEEMLQVIKAPDGTTVLRGMPGMQEYFCYICPNRVVVSEKHPGRKETLRLRMFDTTAFLEWKEQIEYDNRSD